MCTHHTNTGYTFSCKQDGYGMYMTDTQRAKTKHLFLKHSSYDYSRPNNKVFQILIVCQCLQSSPTSYKNV